MASTTALFTGLSGLSTNSRNLDIIGNNISNVNTTAFKSNRMLFATQFSRTLNSGTSPSAVSGGSNPAQIGLGVAIAGTQRDFSNGAISPTGDERDMAIEGDGFFIVDQNGQQFYTRAGSFRPNRDNELVTIAGERVFGFGVDENFNVVEGQLQALQIPVGSLTLAQATQNVNFRGNLAADGDIAQNGSVVSLEALQDTAGAIATGATLLTAIDAVSLDDTPSAASGTALFTAGQILEATETTKGGRILPSAQLEVTAATTVDDLLAFLNDAYGINTTVTNGDATTPGAAIDPATGVISITGNHGESNDLALTNQSFRILDADGSLATTSPFDVTKSQAATGESISTAFVAYDSLGIAVTVDITMVLESKNTGIGTTWRYYAESGDDSDVDLTIGTGTLTFDENGRYVDPGFSPTVTIDRTGVGSTDPLTLNLQFASDSEILTSLGENRGSTIAATQQDGAPIGTLASYSVGLDGIITGAFTNGLTRTLGQVALAVFANPEGLVDIGANLFQPGANSGTPLVAQPTTLGAGRIVGGSLELSNVDLSKEFVNLILAQTGYSASSRIISTTDQLIQQLLVLGR